MESVDTNRISRRGLLSAVGAGVVSYTVLPAERVFGSAANSKINIGMIGCGGRGTWIANLFKEHGGYNIVAAADYFQDRVDSFGDTFNIPPERRFTRLSGYLKLLESKVDAVVIESPPYFHPQHAQAAIEAGAHVYLAKPVAVDVPGCQTIESLGKAASQKNLCMLVDFQTRAVEPYITAIRKVHQGAIGDIVFGDCFVHVDRLNKAAEPDTPEARLRNWVFDKALSGDIIVEQNIHVLDVMSWIMDEPPVYAMGTGGRKVRTDVGDNWDYFTVLYEYPDKVGVTFSSRQFNAQGTQPDGYWARMHGTKGVLETRYGGQVVLRSKDFYKGDTPGIYKEGAVNNIGRFYESVTQGVYDNPTVSPSVRSNLVSLLGYHASVKNRIVTWQELTASTEKVDGRIEQFKT